MYLVNIFQKIKKSGIGFEKDPLLQVTGGYLRLPVFTFSYLVCQMVNTCTDVAGMARIS